MFLRNVGWLSTDYKSSYLRRKDHSCVKWFVWYTEKSFYDIAQTRLMVEIEIARQRFVENFHIKYEQGFWNVLWVTWRSPFMTLCKPGFLTNRYHWKSEFSWLFLLKLAHIEFWENIKVTINRDLTPSNVVFTELYISTSENVEVDYKLLPWFPWPIIFKPETPK
jgi:hypothetical protein